MRVRTTLAALLCLAPAVPVCAAGPEASPSMRLHAAVYLVRGSVAGNSIGAFGPHVQDADSAWHRLSLSNVITYGFGANIQGDRRWLYAACGNGLHRSTDDGATWRILTGWRTMEILGVLPHPVSPSLLYISTPWGVFRSKDAGESWFPAREGFARWFVRQLAFDVRSTDVLYATSEDDLYTSTDGGDRWRPSGVNSGAVLAFLQHPRVPEVLLAGCEDSGIRRSTDGGVTWTSAQCPVQAPVYAFAASPDGRELYATGWQTGIWHSTDLGRTWEVLWAPPSIEAFFCLLVDPNDARHLYAGADGNGVYESRDGGRTWNYAGLNGGKIKQLFMYP